MVDSDLRSITPEWIDLLRPAGAVSPAIDFVAPYYHRHKYDGTITNSIVYPLTRALYGLRVRQPIGGEFGMSRAPVRALPGARGLGDRRRALRDRHLDDHHRDRRRLPRLPEFPGRQTARRQGPRRGPQRHAAPGGRQRLPADAGVRTGLAPARNRAVDLFGFRFDVGLDPIDVNVDRMLHLVQRGCKDLREVWQLAMQPATFREITALGHGAASTTFHLPDELWARLVYDFALAWRRRALDRGHLLRSLTPLYMGRVASFVIDTRSLVSAEVEERMECLCRAYEDLKPYLIENWAAQPAGGDGPSPATGAGGAERAGILEAWRRKLRPAPGGGATDVVDASKNH